VNLGRDDNEEEEEEAVTAIHERNTTQIGNIFVM